jgi:uncharacterized protein involved in outer membrane biogenesis
MTTRDQSPPAGPVTAKVRRILKLAVIGVLALLGTAVIGVYLAVRSISVDDLRTYLESQTRILIGRELVIDGELRLRIFSLRPAIQAGDVRVRNAAWGSQRDMLRVRRLDAEFDLLALVTGTLRMNRFNLLQPEVLLETNRQGHGNWAFDQPPSSTEPERSQTERLALDIREVLIENGHLLFRNGANGSEYRFALTRLSLRSRVPGDPLSIVLAASVNDHPFALSGQVGPLATFVTSGKLLPLEFAGQMGSARVTIKGVVAQPRKLDGVDVFVTAEGGDLADVFRAFGVEAPPLGRYRLNGKLIGSVQSLAAREMTLVVGDPEHNGARLQGTIRNVIGPVGVDVAVSARIAEPGRWPALAGRTVPVLDLKGRLTQTRDGYAIRDTVVTLGNSRLTGSVAVVLRAPRVKLTAQFSSPMLDMREWVSPPATDTEPKRPQADQHLFSDRPLPLDWLNAFNLDLQFQAERLVWHSDQVLHALHAHAVVADGQLSLSPLLVKLVPDGESLSIGLQVATTPAGKYDVQASVQATAIELTKLLALTGTTAGITGARTDVALALRATGVSMRDLMAGLNGEARIVVGAARLDGRTLYLGTNLLTELFMRANPFSKNEPYTELGCAVIRLPVRDGHVIVDRSVALEMPKANIVASGIIDLQHEDVELHFRSQARQGLGLSTEVSNMFMIRGALAAPSIGVSGKGALRSGVTVGVAVGTAGVSLLVERLMLADRHPCRTALSPASKPE